MFRAILNGAEKDIGSFYAEVYGIVFVADTVEGVFAAVDAHEATMTTRLSSYVVNDLNELPVEDAASLEAKAERFFNELAMEG